MTPTTIPRLAGRALALAAACVALLLAAATPAAADSACGRAVIDDWFDGRIDKTYPLQCYSDAIEMLPRDVRDYSSAEEDMRRALQAARRGQDAPPNRDTDFTPQDPDDPSAPPEAPPSTPDGETDTSSGPVPPGDDEPGPEVAPPTDTESASSIPIPLLILAGLALLLVAAGSAGYLIRRLQARRLPTRAT